MNHLRPELTLGALADLEERQEHGEVLSTDEHALVRSTRSQLKRMVGPSRASLMQRFVSSYLKSTREMMKRWQNANADVLHWIESMPPSKRKRYNHMTMRDARRLMIAGRRPSRGTVAGGRRRESHRSRPGHRRTAASSCTSSADPGDSDPEPTHHPRLTLVKPRAIYTYGIAGYRIAVDR